MRKFTIITLLTLLAFSTPVLATTTDFTADGDITVTGVTFGSGTVDVTILSGSTCEEWLFSDGALTVKNPGGFQISSSNSGVKTIKATRGGATVSCAENSNPGTSSLTLLVDGNTYVIVPSTDVSCTGSAAGVSSGSPSGSSSGSSRKSTASDDTETDTTQETAVETEEAIETAKAVSADLSEPAKDSRGNVTLEQMATDAQTVVSGDVNQLIEKMGTTRNSTAEADYNETIVAKIVEDSGITAQVRNSIVNFVTYGTPATKTLGAGERAGVVNSFKSALGKAPTTAEDWNDVVKIANGRWPSQRSQKAEDRANINFKAVYLRTPDRTNSHDDAAITVMAYGLRPANRNLNSEKTAIKSFSAIYDYYPEKATAWDVVRAIAYSGAIR